MVHFLCRMATRIIEVVNRISDKFDLVVATQDWHPPTHKSFANNHPGHKPGDRISLGDIDQIFGPTIVSRVQKVPCLPTTST